jgi:phosphogluconate dehydratase
MELHTTVEAVTDRISSRSQATRQAYLARLDAASSRKPGAERMGCANVAHAVAAMPAKDKLKIVAQRAPNIAIVNAYNDMLSAHAPLQHYPDIIKREARKHGATAQVAGGVPAMCDGVTQGTPGMELSLFSRDVIAMATAVSLSHDMYDGALMLGVCDKIVPGLLIGALHFGHLPTVFVPAGPMTSGLSNSEKGKVRELAAQGLVGRAELLQAESAAYHGMGTCTFYGTANSNQMLLEAMGLHVPGTAFVNPGQALREELTREAVRTVLGVTQSNRFAPIGRIVDERCIVNAMVALLATGGSTNHLIHWVAVARAAGIAIDWDDFSALSKVVPTLTHVYPNGSADVNQFQAAGGPGLVIRELLDAGFMHEDVLTVRPAGLREYARVPHPAVQAVSAAQAADASRTGAVDGPAVSPAHPDQADDAVAPIVWVDAGASKDESIVRPATRPFSAHGGLMLLQGNLGRSVIKVSAVPDDRHIIEAPARVFDSQEALHRAFQADELNCDVVCVVRWQGPQANGMPELHKLTPPLAVLQGKGFKVALVTDGRMSGASGKVPAAIHVSPEARDGGPLAKVLDGDVIRLDAVAGTLDVLVAADVWTARPLAVMPAEFMEANGLGMGRELFAGMRRNVTTAEEGACSWL